MTRLRRILIPRCLRECTRLWRTQLYSCVSRFKIFGHIWTARRTCLVPRTWGRRASPWRSSDSWHVSVSLQVKSQGSVKTKAIPAIPRISNCFEAFRAQGRFEFDRLEDTRQVCCWPRAIWRGRIPRAVSEPSKNISAKSKRRSRCWQMAISTFRSIHPTHPVRLSQVLLRSSWRCWTKWPKRWRPPWQPWRFSL